MRIIGGKYRGRIIKMPKGISVRPTQDRVREAIFNIIREIIPESRILDLYAGSGAFGIEALSRGAKEAIFVDNSLSCIKTIRSNLSILDENNTSSQVLKIDALKAISRLGEEKGKFDIIFLDPPYHKDIAKNTLIKLDACDILSQRSFVIAEHFKKDTVPEELGNMNLFRTKKYGDTIISFYNKSK